MGPQSSEVSGEPVLDGGAGEAGDVDAGGSVLGSGVLDAVEPEQSPVGALSVVGDQVPDALAQNVPIRTDVAFAHTAVLVGVKCPRFCEVPQVLFRLSRWENLEYAKKI